MALNVCSSSVMNNNNDKTKTAIGKIMLSLENCLLPSERLYATPSVSDGLDYENEIDLRILGCELIQVSGILLRLPQVAMATGQVLFQRYYYSKSFVRYNMEVTAMSCVTLASKIEESPRRIRDVINVFHHMKQIRNGKNAIPLILDENYVNLKNQVIKAERRLLKELGFCVHVKHPHKIIVTLLQVLDNERNQNLMQTSWNYMNDSLRTNVFVKYSPETIACACIYLSARVLKVPLPNNPPWYEIFGVLEHEIRDVCISVLKLYARNKPNQSELERIVENLRKEHENAKLRAKGLIPENGAHNSNIMELSPGSRTNSPSNIKLKLELSSPKSSQKTSQITNNNSENSPTKRKRSLSPSKRSKSRSKSLSPHKRNNYDNDRYNNDIHDYEPHSRGGYGYDAYSRSRSRDREKDRRHHHHRHHHSKHKRSDYSRSRSRSTSPYYRHYHNNKHSSIGSISKKTKERKRSKSPFDRNSYSKSRRSRSRELYSRITRSPRR